VALLTRCVGGEQFRRDRDRRHEHHHDWWRSDERARQPGRISRVTIDGLSTSGGGEALSPTCSRTSAWRRK
jgi:hypothetical protein